MKDLMIDWVEEHKGEREDGTWFILDADWLDDGTRIFTTEEELDNFLWDYIVDNPDTLFPTI